MNSIYPSKIWEFILESNEKRLKEIKNSSIRREINALRNIWNKYVNKGYYK